MANKGAYVAGSLINKKGWLTIDLLLMHMNSLRWVKLWLCGVLYIIFSPFNEFSDRWLRLFIRPSLMWNNRHFPWPMNVLSLDCAHIDLYFLVLLSLGC